uniref:Uncharacterized protein n=1 Tax=Cucumis melo TaxID=3656 RepID=A0A9I9EGZ1_CUCME
MILGSRGLYSSIHINQQYGTPNWQVVIICYNSQRYLGHGPDTLPQPLNASHLYALRMQVQECKQETTDVTSFFKKLSLIEMKLVCKDEVFHVEDVEAKITMTLSIFQLRWFIEMEYIYKKEKVECGRIETSKFRTKNEWVLRCIAWPSTEGRSFIHIPIGEDKQEWKSFGKMLGDFKDIHEYKIWFSSQTKFNTISKQPIKSMKGSYAEIA